MAVITFAPMRSEITLVLVNLVIALPVTDTTVPTLANVLKVRTVVHIHAPTLKGVTCAPVTLAIS